MIMEEITRLVCADLVTKERVAGGHLAQFSHFLGQHVTVN